MKTIHTFLSILAFSLLIIWTGCDPNEDEDEFDIVSKWVVESVIAPNSDIGSGDWSGFEFEFIGATSYKISNVSSGLEVLWTTDPTLFSSSEGGEFSSGTYVYTAATTTTAGTLVLNESSGGSFSIEVETDDSDLDKMTLLVNPQVSTSGRVSGIEDPWEFYMEKKGV